MGNHTIDCEFCGRDMRAVGDRCCSERIASEDAKHKAQLAAETEIKTFLAAHGIDCWDGRTVRAVDVVKFIKTCVHGVEES